MNKLSVFTFDPAGPALPADVARLYTPAAMTSENGESDWRGQADRVEELAAGLLPNAVLLANCEHYTDNTLAAVGCGQACRRSNPFVRYGCYHPRVNGGTYDDVAGSNGLDNTRAREAKRRSDKGQMAAIAELNPFVDVWFLDVFSAEGGAGGMGGAGMKRLLGRDAAASREIVFGRRVAAVAHTGKPWYGVLGVVAVPDRLEKPRGRVVESDAEFSADTLYADAAWCFKNGAEGVVVMAFDPCRRKSEGTGAVVVTPEIVRALRGIGKDF